MGYTTGFWIWQRYRDQGDYSVLWNRNHKTSHSQHKNKWNSNTRNDNYQNTFYELTLWNCFSFIKRNSAKLVNSPIFKDFTLIGGTCLSLQLGHRRSIDIDLFTDIDYGTMNTKEMKEFIQRSFPYSENTDSLDTSALGYTLYMGTPYRQIKVDFSILKIYFPIQEIDHIRIADIREIAAMKLSAITEEEPRQKTLGYPRTKWKYSFKDMIDWGIKGTNGVLQRKVY